MAMIDYGAILKVNGIIKNRNQFFMDMLEATGWVDNPRKRHEDCDRIDKHGYSECDGCPRATRKHYSTEELGEWDMIVGDCHGQEIRYDNSVDGNFFAYAGDEDFTVAVYKMRAVVINRNGLQCDEWGSSWNRQMVCHHVINTKTGPVHIKIKRIAEGEQLYMRFIYKGDVYELVYGYGIDSNQKTWNRIKHKYISNKNVIRFVDNFWKESLH